MIAAAHRARRALVAGAALVAWIAVAPSVAQSMTLGAPFLGQATSRAAPAPPTLTGSSPASPATDNAPEILGTAAAGTVVRIYADVACSGGELVAQATAAVLASPGITVNVADNTTTTFYATAANGDGETSLCSTTAVTYTHVPPPPPAPVFAGTDPDSPANDNMPFVTGSAVAGGFVHMYTNPTCSEPRAADAPSAAFASPGIQTSVLNDTTTTLSATVTNGAGQTSACSTSTLMYVEDSTPPETTIDSGPALTVPAGTTVRFEFSSSEAGSRFECHLHEPGFQPCASPATFPSLPAGSSARNAQLQVRAIDRAANEDATPAARAYEIAAAAVPPPPPPLVTGCTLRTVAISGTPAADALNGTARADVILGKAGNDLVRGLAGNDCLYGEAGNDRLRGGSGSDRLFGGPGADRLEGESGNDRMTGAAGNDRLTDRSGRDSFSGGSGSDVIDARDTSLAGRRVRDTVSCGPGRDRALVDRRDTVRRDCERVTRR